jgi:hypothetical protein
LLKIIPCSIKTVQKVFQEYFNAIMTGGENTGSKGMEIWNPAG